MLHHLCRIAVLGAALAAASVSHAQLISGGSSSGSGATPGGSSGQLQFNNAGVFGGGAGTAWDDTNRTLTITGATVTTSTPLLDLSQTWNAGAVAFSALKLNVTNTASASGSLLLDLQVGGVSQFKTYKDGTLEIPYTSSGYSVGNVKTASGYASLGQSGIAINSSARVGWSSTTGNVGAGVDSGISRLDAASLAIGNGAAGDVSATLSFARGDFYNFRADASNYERGSLYWSANYLWLTTAQAGTGAARGMVIATQGDHNIYFKINGTDRMNVSSSGLSLASPIIFGIDNTYDIGASGASRPRAAYIAGKIVTGSTTLHETSVALTNGAAAATGTLTNAPVAGNPTKWIPINDNGTTRYVPAW